VVFEACAAGLPVLAANPPFADLLGDVGVTLLFDREDADGLASGLVSLAGLPSPERRRIGAELRQRVVERHSVESWADGLLRVCRGEANASS